MIEQTQRAFDLDLDINKYVLYLEKLIGLYIYMNICFIKSDIDKNILRERLSISCAVVAIITFLYFNFGFYMYVYIYTL